MTQENELSKKFHPSNCAEHNTILFAKDHRGAKIMHLFITGAAPPATRMSPLQGLKQCTESSIHLGLRQALSPEFAILTLGSGLTINSKLQALEVL